ncbi:MAG: N-acetylglucosamine-6-phosphate deacetylase [Lachnospiraceae bacterium]|nr:N-acetylglucosamine-6-phosphate deacetylase [Lachnospiraceae bacterium]
MEIKNAKVYTEKGIFEERNVCTDGGRIAGVSTDGKIIDGAGCYLIPGLIDIHFHGCRGYDFCDGSTEAIEAMACYEASRGVTAMVPATMTLGKEKLFHICRTAAAYSSEKGAALCGINLEGPFLSPQKLGAMNGNYVRKPDVELFRELQEASGQMIRLLAIAPELPGAEKLIRELKEEVVLSVAHTAADYGQAMWAFQNGVHHVTHLYNAMSGLNHRAPGVVGAAADAPLAEVELICDGIHVHPAVVRQTFKMFGDDRIILISDSMEATGMPDGDYMLGGQKVVRKGRRATLADGTIAGSATDLMDCLRTAVLDVGIPLESAVKCATANPAKSVGIFDRYGSITIGKVADLLLLREEDLRLEKVILRGKENTQAVCSGIR